MPLKEFKIDTSRLWTQHFMKCLSPNSPRMRKEYKR